MRAVLRTPAGHWILVDAGPAGERSGCGPTGGGAVSPAAGRPVARARGRLPRPRRPPRRRAVGAGAARDRAGDRARRATWPTRGTRAFSIGSLGRRRAVAPGAHGRAVRARRRRASRSCIPMPGWADWGEDVNEDSLVLLVEYGDFQALFAGDAGFPAEVGDGGAAPAGGSAQGGASRESRQHRRRLARRAAPRRWR